MNDEREFDTPVVMEEAAAVVRLMKLHIPEVVTYIATCPPIMYKDFECVLKAFNRWQQFEAIMEMTIPAGYDWVRVWTAIGHLIYKEAGRDEARL